MVDKNIKIKYDDDFKKTFKKIDNSYKIKVKKQINKIIQNPEIGKPMKANRKGTWEVYVSPFRLSYAFFLSEDWEDQGKEIYKLVFLDLYHKDNQ
ncbi:MAG: hypothetical protein IJG09_06560 [Methanobrevibacter sp.]|nr:hypothetical protein [Methanobrevibacter sp.]